MIPNPTNTPAATATAPACSPPDLTLRLEHPDCVIEIQGQIGQTVPIELVLYNIANGVSGFIIEVSVVNPDAVNIVGVQHPAYLPSGFPSPPFVITNSDQEAKVDFQAADLNHQLEGLIDEVTLATISIKLEQAGTTSLVMSVRRLDGDIPVGQDLLPELSVISATLTVSP